jgi:CubicO group peptidase (beta-lactamase class C family)
VTGLALDGGLIRSVDDPVKNYVDDGTFDSPHNSKITWRHLLNQTSEWEGTLWGKPDWADRFNGKKRPYVDPGTAWTYNDVRVNLLAYSLLHVWRKPLPLGRWVLHQLTRSRATRLAVPASRCLERSTPFV